MGKENSPGDFEQQVLDHVDMVYGVALKLTRNRMDAQHLAEDTLVKAFRSREEFGARSPIKAWLLTTLRNTFINRYGHNVRQPLLPRVKGGTPVASRAPNR